MNQVFLHRVLDYDLETGIFTWLVSSGSAKPGKIAGCYSDDGYIRIRIGGTLYLAQRLAWLYVTGNWPDNQIDHEDGIKGNNSWDNLRDATNSQNQMNRTNAINNQSGYKGVHFCNTREMWIARLQRDNVVYHLGEYETADEAGAAYEVAAKIHFGEFARVG